jgi:hypothetical protein
MQVKECTSVIDAAISGGFTGSSSSAMARTTGVLYQHVADAAAAEGLELMACVPKFEMPEMPGMGGAMKLATGGSVNIEVKNTVQTFFTPIAAGETVETTLVYAQMSVNASLGFANAEVAITEDTISGSIFGFAQQGWRLVGMSCLTGVSQSQTKVLSATSTAQSVASCELVFQKKTSSPACELSIVQNCFTITMNMGKMSSTVPDILPYLNSQGALGWELSGLLAPPNAQAPPVGSMSFTIQAPFHIYMQKKMGQTQVFQYTSMVYSFTMKMKMVGMGGKMEVEGDIVPVVMQYAEAGWLLKGQLQLPAQQKMKGMKVEMSMPILLIFVAPVAGGPDAT